MWPSLCIIVAVLALVIHLAWRRRHARVQSRLEEEQARWAVLGDQHQQALAEAETRQQVLFNSMVEGLILIDGSGRIRVVNEAFERLFGLSGDVRGRTIMEALRLGVLQELVDRTRTQGQVINCELELPGRRSRFLEVNASALLDRHGHSQEVILVFHDLTRIKQLENTRKEFVANVSHELRTPLSMIKGYVETLLDSAKDDPAVATRFLQTIRKHADRLTYLIEDLLNVSMLESGRTVMNLKRFELRSLTNEVLTDLQARVGEKRVTLTNAVPAGLEVKADADRIHQVMFNLIDNALKYGRAEGHVRIDARTVTDGMIEMAVHDDGPGIPAEFIDRIFERFYRVDRARSREQGGTGLGLAIVKHIVQSHGGEVWAESPPGKGTTFFLTLPRAEPEL